MQKNNNILLVLIISIAAFLVAIIIGMITFIVYTNSYQNKTAESTATPIASAAATEVPTQSPPSILYVTNVQNSIYLRQTPDENGTILTTIPLGAAVDLIKNEHNGFTHIRYNGTEGYSKTEYLTADPNASYQRPVPQNNQYPVSSLTAVIDTMYVANVQDSIYLRTAASENASIITTIPLGAAVGFITDMGNGFYKISYNGQMGYSKAMYLRYGTSSYRSPNSSYMRVTGVKYSIYLRETPSQNSVNICEIPVGSRVEYLGSYNNTYYKIRYNGITGYATAAYLTFE